MIAFELFILECITIKTKHLNTHWGWERMGYKVGNTTTTKNQINQMMDGSAAWKSEMSDLAVSHCRCRKS